MDINRRRKEGSISKSRYNNPLSKQILLLYSTWNSAQCNMADWMGVGFEGESIYVRVSQVELVVENPPANAGNIGDAGSIPGSRRSLGQEDPQLRKIPGLGRSPGGGHGNPLQYSCLENPHGQKSLVGYSPSCHKELDTTEQLSTQGINDDPYCRKDIFLKLQHFYL